MLISDTSFHKNNGDEELYVAIRSSETDQRSLSSNLIICKQGDETVCPVRLLKKYLQIRTSSTSCLFAHLDGTGLTRYQNFRWFYRKRCPFVKSETIIDLIRSG